MYVQRKQREINQSKNKISMKPETHQSLTLKNSRHIYRNTIDIKNAPKDHKGGPPTTKALALQCGHPSLIPSIGYCFPISELGIVTEYTGCNPNTFLAPNKNLPQNKLQV